MTMFCTSRVSNRVLKYFYPRKLFVAIMSSKMVSSTQFSVPIHTGRNLLCTDNSITVNEPSTTAGSKKKKRLHPYEILSSELNLAELYLNNNNIDFQGIKTLCEQHAIMGTFWHSFCMNYFYKTGNVTNGTLLMNFIRYEELKTVSVMVYAIFIALLGESRENHQKLVYQTYAELEEIIDVFNIDIVKYLIKGFCGTENWRKSLHFLEMEKLQSSEKNPSIRTPIILRAFQEGDIHLASKLLDEIADEKKEPHQNVFQGMVELAKKNNTTVSMETLVDLLKEKRWYPDEETAEKIKAYFLELDDERWKCQSDSIQSSGICRSCDFQLPLADFNSNDLPALEKDILKNLIIRSDIYLNSQPEELNRFLHFLEKHGPFDVVIDGLNIGYFNYPLPSALKLRLAVEYFSKQKMKIFVMGRKHMQKAWGKTDMQIIQKFAHIFYLENVSQDDPFLLYAACKSGENTLILSRDYLRNHGTRIGAGHQQTYYKWLQCRQITDYRFTRFKTIVIPEPSGHEIEPVYSKTQFHIPYRHKDGFQWLCCVKQT